MTPTSQFLVHIAVVHGWSFEDELMQQVQLSLQLLCGQCPGEHHQVASEATVPCRQRRDEVLSYHDVHG